MAEYCLACWNKMNDTKYTKDDVEMSECLYICEGCEQYTWVVMRTPEERERYWSAIFTWQFDILCIIITAIGCGVRRLYQYYKKRAEGKINKEPFFEDGEADTD